MAVEKGHGMVSRDRPLKAVVAHTWLPAEQSLKQDRERFVTSPLEEGMRPEGSWLAGLEWALWEARTTRAREERDGL